MGICFNKEIKSKKPSISALISVSSISKSTKLESIQKKFEFTRVIGFGVFGTVREALKKTTKSKAQRPKIYAIKSLVKSKVERKLELLRRELDILKTVDHPNIIRLYEVYEDEKYLHLVTEFCGGGDLLDYLLAKGSLDEEEVLRIIYKALSAIKYLHRLNICHRDIKPDNFLLTSKGENAEVKLVDFGMSNFVGVELNTFAGTPYYMAPEVIRGFYSTGCDIWSLGVLIYFLLSGKQPFQSGSVNDVFAKILNGSFSFQEPCWDLISENAKDLITRMLVADPNLRISASDALLHPAFSSMTTNSHIHPKVFNSLKRFKSPSKLWNEAMLIFVKNLSTEQINSLKIAFTEIDKGKTGLVTANDIAAAMIDNNYTIAYNEFTELVKSIEYLGKGKLNYSQFLVAAMDRKREISEEQLWMLFKHFDLDDNGEISLDELRYVLEKSGFGVPDSEIEEIIQEFKERAPDSMNYETFVNFMRVITEESESVQNSGRKLTNTHHFTTIIRRVTKESGIANNSTT